MDNDLLQMDYSIFNNDGDIKPEITALTAEVKKLVAFQEDLRQKNLVFERMNMADRKLATNEEAVRAIRSDLVKLERLGESNKEWMERMGGVVEYLLQREKDREGGEEGELTPTLGPGSAEQA